MGRDILRSERRHIGNFRRRSSSGNLADAETLRRRASNSVRQNDLRVLVIDRADNFYRADIFNPIRCRARERLIATDNAVARSCRLICGGNIDGGFDNLGDCQGRTIPDIAVPRHVADIFARDNLDGNFIDGRNIRRRLINRHCNFRRDIDSRKFDTLRLSVTLSPPKGRSF